MMKVALIIERADIALGGAERSVFELAGQLTADGLDVTILAASGRLDAQNVRVLCKRGGTDRPPAAVFERALRTHLAENRYDIVHSTLPLAFAHVYQPRGGTYTEAMIQNAASYENPHVRRFKRITHFVNRRRWALLGAERTICRCHRETMVAALSEYVAGHFRKHYHLPEDRLVVIPNAVKPPKQPAAAETDQLKTRLYATFNLKQADNPMILLFAANNFRLKGLPHLIRAMCLAQARRPARPIRLVITGSGKQRPFVKLAEKLRINDKIAFLGRVNSIAPLLAACDTAVLPTWYDPSSRFILEAIMFAKPVITTQFNGAAEMFKSGRGGIVIDRPDNIDSLTEALLFFADSDNATRASTDIIEDRLAERVSIAAHAGAMVRLYESIIRKHRR